MRGLIPDATPHQSYPEAHALTEADADVGTHGHVAVGPRVYRILRHTGRRNVVVASNIRIAPVSSVFEPTPGRPPPHRAETSCAPSPPPERSRRSGGPPAGALLALGAVALLGAGGWLTRRRRLREDRG